MEFPSLGQSLVSKMGPYDWTDLGHMDLVTGVSVRLPRQGKPWRKEML